MEKFIQELAIALVSTVGGVLACFFLLFLSRKFKINWLTNFLTRPTEQDRPPAWVVVAAGTLVMGLTVVWFLLPRDLQSAVRQFIVGP